jgi:hypothetical protein
MLGCCYQSIFTCLASITIYIDPWKSFMKFGIKKSHEMISHIFAWITLSSRWKPMMSTKPCNLAPTTLIELYNKSHERFMLGKCQENTSIGLKLGFKLYRDATLTSVDQSLTVLAWSCTLNKSWILSGVEQTLFLDQEPDQLGTKSNRSSNLESTAVFRVRKFC